MNSQVETLAIAIKAGADKVHKTLIEKALLGFLGGALIGLGFFLDIRVVASIPKDWTSLANLIGGMVFPLGLIAVCITGAELLTGNFMAVTVSCFDKKVKPSELIVDFIEIAIFNMIGGIVVAWLLTDVTGMVAANPDNLIYHTKLLAMAASKVAATPLVAFVSGIGCNWLVALAVWQFMSAKDMAGKILGVWFPTMAFVAIGFQHSIANTFLIPAAIFAGAPITWGQFFGNFGMVALGNLVGAGVFVALFHYLAFRRGLKELEAKQQA